tara:strand:- start:800 stop:2917 length:2118 start_codon:yes stop_codon:yes gene_type:complete
MANKAIGYLTFNFGANMAGFNKAMKKAQRSVKRFGKSMKNIGGSMTTNLTMPLVGLGAVAIKTFADFEQAMLKVKAISGATAEEFKMLEADAKRLGSTTMFTASQVAELQLNLSKLGLTPQEINKSTESILALAQATDSDLGQAATVAAKTMNAFGLEAEDMTMIADVMADSFSSTALDMNKFETAMASVAPVAKQAGATLQETTATLGVLVNNGVEASTAGTALRNIFLDLAKEGMTFEDAMNQINNSTEPLAVSMEMFGKRGANVATILAQSGTEIKNLTADFVDSTGEAKAMADIMDSGVAGALRKLKSQAEGVAISLGEMLIPVFQKLLNFIQNSLATWSGLNENTKTIAVSIGLFVAALGPAISLMGSLTIAFSALISPIGLTVAAIASIVAAFAYVRENWEAFKERLSDWSWWRNAIAEAVADLVEILGGPLAKALGLGDTIRDFKKESKEYEHEFTTFGEAIKNQAKDVAKSLGILNNPLGLGGGSGGGGATNNGGEDMQLLPRAGSGPDMSKLPMGEIALGNTELEKTTTLLDTLQEKFGLTKDSMQEYAEATGQSLSQGASSFAEYGEKVKNSIREVISGLISQGVAAAVSKAMASSPNPLLIPVVAGLASGLAKTAFNSLIPAFASGGIVSGPTVGLMGEYPGAGSGNPEVIAPLNKLKGMMGSGVQNVQVEGRISGNDIWLSNSKTNSQRNRAI